MPERFVMVSDDQILCVDGQWRPLRTMQFAQPSRPDAYVIVAHDPQWFHPHHLPESIKVVDLKSEEGRALRIHASRLSW